MGKHADNGGGKSTLWKDWSALHKQHDVFTLDVLLDLIA
jgi:hypothetical protein